MVDEISLVDSLSLSNENSNVVDDERRDDYAYDSDYDNDYGKRNRTLLSFFKFVLEKAGQVAASATSSSSYSSSSSSSISSLEDEETYSPYKESSNFNFDLNFSLTPSSTPRSPTSFSTSTTATAAISSATSKFLYYSSFLLSAGADGNDSGIGDDIGLNYNPNYNYNYNNNYNSSVVSNISYNGIIGIYKEENWTTDESSLAPSPSTPTGGGGPSEFPGKFIIIPLYTLIFLLSIIGNLLVIVTLARNRRMRTVTNVFLLNLAISDLLLGVFCVPITLVGQILRNFIFGHVMCKIIPYFQAVSVSVGVWTLVAISLERFFAICRPLQSRKWQTRSHAYKMIVAVWLTTLTWNIPITFVSQLQPIRDTGRYKCREIWPNQESEKVFNLILDFLLFLIPLCIMGIAYSLIVSKLWKGLRSEILHTRSFHHPPVATSPCIGPPEVSLELSNHSHYSYKLAGNSGGSGSVTEGRTGTMRMSSTSREPTGTGGVSNEILTFKGGKGIVVRWKRKEMSDSVDFSCARLRSSDPNKHQHQHQSQTSSQMNGRSNNTNNVNNHNHNHNHNNYVHNPPPTAHPKFSRAIRSTYTGKSIEAKKKVIRMLFVLVLEFFIAWTPLYVMNTFYLFDPETMYHFIGPMGVSLIQLLAYSSSCSNPITYCFMNLKFRQAFIKVFQFGFAPKSKAGIPTIGRGSDLSANDSLIYGVQGSTMNKSEVVVLECEERV